MAVDLNALRTALAQFQAVYGELSAVDASDSDIEESLTNLKDFSGLLRNFAEGKISNTFLTEKGASLSAKSRQSLQAVMEVLLNLLSPYQTPPNPGMAKEASAVVDNLLTEAELNAKSRKAIPTAQFADPKNRRYPIHDKAHADNAAARLEQNKGSESDYSAIKARITAAQKKFGEDKGEKEPDTKDKGEKSELNEDASFHVGGTTHDNYSGEHVHQHDDGNPGVSTHEHVHTHHYDSTHAGHSHMVDMHAAIGAGGKPSTAGYDKGRVAEDTASLPNQGKPIMGTDSGYSGRSDVGATTGGSSGKTVDANYDPTTGSPKMNQDSGDSGRPASSEGIGSSATGKIGSDLDNATGTPRVGELAGMAPGMVKEIVQPDMVNTSQPSAQDGRQTNRGLQDGSQEMRESLPSGLQACGLTTAIVLAEGSDPTRNIYKCFVIAEGMSGNRVNYTRPVLKESMKLLENRPIYVDHPAGARQGDNSRSLATKVGWWENPQYVEDMQFSEATGSTPATKISGITAEAHLFENSGQEWFPKMMREAIAAGRGDQIGFSILAAGEATMGRDNLGVFKQPTKISYYASADAVAEPGAKGRPLAFVASSGKDPDVDTLTSLTAEELRTARPDLVEALSKPKTDVSTAVPAAFQETIDKVTALQNQLGQQRTVVYLESKLAGSHLPDGVKTTIKTEVGETIMAEDRIDELVAKYENMAAQVANAANHANVLNDGRSFIPYVGIETGMGPLDQICWSFDEMFGMKIPDDKKNKFPHIYSIREAWSTITGDPTCERVIPSRSPLGNQWYQMVEALPNDVHIVGGTTITMTNLLGTSMNRALVSRYQAQPKWWEAIVTKRTITNFKQQDRIRLHNFGSLTNRPVGTEEYTEMDWGETAENYTPTGYGNVVTIKRRAVINDDLRGIAMIPDMLADSAIITINEYYSNLRTQSSHTGPTLADGFHVGNNAQHQGNLITLPLTRANAVAARAIGMKMQNDANKRIGVIPRILVVPVDLEPIAFELTTSKLTPGTANNEPNILSAPMGFSGFVTDINDTSASAWSLMADPNQIESIEAGFLFGKEEPELFAQRDEMFGMLFTNDVIAWKVRHEYGGNWIDYRGVVISVP